MFSVWRLGLTENQHGVIDEEVLHIEWVQRGVAVACHNHYHPCQSEVGAVWLTPSVVWQTLPVQALLLGCLVVENEGRAHHDVGDDTARSHQIDKPAQDFGRSISDLQERQTGKDHGDGKGEQWNTILGAVAEESWCATLEGHAVQGTCRTVSVRVTGRKDGSTEQGVDQVRESIDPEILHGDHVWRGRGSSATAGLSRNDAHKSRVGIGNNDTTSQGAANEENGKPDVHGLESALDVGAWTLGLGCHHGDVLGANDSEGCRPETGEKSLKSSKAALGTILGNRVGGVPVAKTVSITIGVTAHLQDLSIREFEKRVPITWQHTIVTKVKAKSIKIKTTLPPDSQNSASPYALTARQLSKP